MSTKTERMELRLSPELKELLERASELSGQVMASLVRSLLHEGAQEIVERHTRTELSQRDFRRFLEIIESDEEPAPALKAAFRRHKPAS